MSGQAGRAPAEGVSEGPAAAEDAAAVAARAVKKAFGGVQALRGASFAARAGEVHALVGENGAGKSTLIKILGGRFPPDQGTILLNEQPVRLSGPADAAGRGIGTVFQELTLLPWLTVAENLLFGREPRAATGLIRRGSLAEQAQAILAGLGIFHIDPRALAADISLSERQIVEIARVVTKKPAILFLDEPTSSLVEREVQWLFERIRELRALGTAIVFTSHRWNEITSIADRITIFRNGAEVGTFTEIEEGEAITLMTGRRVDALYPRLPPLAPGATDALALTEAVLPNKVGPNKVGPNKEGPNKAGPNKAGPNLAVAASGPTTDLSLHLRAGEILGIGGLAGQGHRELFLGLFGAPALPRGKISVGGKVMRIRRPADAINARLGIALVPEDRKTEGLLLPLSVRDNLTLPILKRISRLGVIRAPTEGRMSREIIAALGVRTPGPAQRVGALSGGNQQKVLVGRWLLAESVILLLYDVTRGVDVATRHEIYDLIMRLAGEGKAILLYSSDTEELAHLCHRVLVLRDGRIAAELAPPELSAEAIVSASMRQARAA